MGPTLPAVLPAPGSTSGLPAPGFCKGGWFTSGELPPGSGVPNRVHGAFCSDEEVHRVVADWKRRGDPLYIDGLLDEGGQTPVTAGELKASSSDEDDESDALYDEAVHYVTKSRRASISSVQRKLRIGYNRAARLIEAMEAAGVVTEMGTNGQREVLAPPPVED